MPTRADATCCAAWFTRTSGRKVDALPGLLQRLTVEAHPRHDRFAADAAVREPCVLLTGAVKSEPAQRSFDLRHTWADSVEVLS